MCGSFRVVLHLREYPKPLARRIAQIVFNEYSIGVISPSPVPSLGQPSELEEASGPLDCARVFSVVVSWDTRPRFELFYGEDGHVDLEEHPAYEDVLAPAYAGDCARYINLCVCFSFSDLRQTFSKWPPTWPEADTFVSQAMGTGNMSPRQPCGFASCLTWSRQLLQDAGLRQFRVDRA